MNSESLRTNCIAFFRLPYDVNVIVVDWASLAAAPWYDTAAANTDPVGRYIASFVDYLVGEGKTSYDKIHFSGHSLGRYYSSIEV